MHGYTVSMLSLEPPNFYTAYIGVAFKEEHVLLKDQG